MQFSSRKNSFPSIFPPDSFQKYIVKKLIFLQGRWILEVISKAYNALPVRSMSSLVCFTRQPKENVFWDECLGHTVLAVDQI